MLYEGIKHCLLHYIHIILVYLQL